MDKIEELAAGIVSGLAMNIEKLLQDPKFAELVLAQTREKVDLEWLNQAWANFGHGLHYNALFTGKYCPSFDDKMRISVPKDIRDTLKEIAPEKPKDLYMVKWQESTLTFYPSAYFDVHARFFGLFPEDQNYRQRFFEGKHVKIDNHGRVRPPNEYLSESLKPSDKVRVCGNGYSFFIKEKD